MPIFKNLKQINCIKIDLKRILDLDKKNRELIQSKEKLEHEKKIISKKLKHKIKGIVKKKEDISMNFGMESEKANMGIISKILMTSINVGWTKKPFLE